MADPSTNEPIDQSAEPGAVIHRIADHRESGIEEAEDLTVEVADPTPLQTDLQAEIEAKQDYVLSELDALDAQILSLLDEFTARLKSGGAAEPEEDDLAA